MARYPFGGTIADYVVSPVDASGLLGQTENLYAETPTLTVTLWSAAAGGSQITDLQTSSGQAISQVTAVYGQIPAFYGPDGVLSMYADAGGGSRTEMKATNAIDLIVALLANQNPVAPGAPSNVVAAVDGLGTVTLSFTPPPSTGSTGIIDYLVTVIPVGSSFTAPGAPTSVTATGGVGSATLSWNAPSNNGGTPITNYQITTTQVS